MKKLLLLFSLLAFYAQADVQLPAIIGDHMVLQQKAKVTLWGWTTTPSERVDIRVDWDTTRYTARAVLGRWSIQVATPAAGGKHEISFTTNSNSLKVSDVVFGEVWVFSGQSNMEWSGTQNLQESLDEMPNANNQDIRFFYIPKATSNYPQDDVRAKWVVCNPTDMKAFSAIGYFFGKKLNQQLKVPMGLISSNWGGTRAEVWVARDSVMKKPHFVQAIKNSLNTVGLNYNAMIAPIVNYNIAGVLWYQGESNVGQFGSYTELMNDLILNWRSAFKKNMPFYFAQIAPYSKYGENNNGAKLREAQTENLKTENTAMVVLSDLVPDVTNIHPTIKVEVANRFANLALVKHYGQEAGPIFYPKYDRLKVEKNKIRIFFKELNGKLMTKDGAEPSHLMIAGEDKVFHPAVGKIDGTSLIVSSPAVPNPVAVRYAFKNDDMPNLFSREGLPVNLFRTDNWDN